MTPRWEDARVQMMLDPSVTNLNTGSFGPLPRPVFEQVTRLRKRLAEEPMDFLLRQMPSLLWEARTRLAQYIQGDARRLLFTANVSVAINIVASGLRLSSPGEILLTDQEYLAMQWCWERAAQRQGLTLRIFPLPRHPTSPDQIVDAAVKAMRAQTRLLFFSHVPSPTGMVLPARELCAEARKRGILSVVDGAHALAMTPLNMAEINADFYASNCHKWLLAPTGTGFLYIGPGNEDRLEPMQVSWGYQRPTQAWDEQDAFGTTPRLRFYEFEGTRDKCPWMSVPAAIDFQDRIGRDAIRERNLGLARYVRQRIGEELRLEAATPAGKGLHGFLTAFRLPAKVDANHWRKALWETYRIEMPLVERPDGLLARVSTHFYNTEAEIDRLHEAMKRLLAT